MRQRMGEKKVKKLAEELGLPIKTIQVRGNTDHRKDLLLEGGKMIYLFKDGTMKEASVKWVYIKDKHIVLPNEMEVQGGDFTEPTL